MIQEKKVEADTKKKEKVRIAIAEKRKIDLKVNGKRFKSLTIV